MKVLICYFSGTGNTKKVIDRYVECFNEHDIEVDLYKVEDKNFSFNLDEYDMMGIAYPIHAFNAPSIMVDFAKSLDKQEKVRKLFIIKSSGEPLALNNISSYKIIKILKKKNFVLTNEYHYVMPYNMIFRHTDNMAYRMWKTAYEVIPVDCEEIVSGKEVKQRHIFMGSFIAWVMRIEHWGGRFNGRKYKVDENCIKCQKCVQSCPTHNIEYKDGKFIFGKNCLMCVRCSFHCPKNAIKIGWFNSWKVNGAYNFNNYNENEKQTHTRYCKRVYKRYFKRCEEKAEAYKSNLNN